MRTSSRANRPAGANAPRRGGGWGYGGRGEGVSPREGKGPPAIRGPPAARGRPPQLSLQNGDALHLDARAEREPVRAERAAGRVPPAEERPVDVVECAPLRDVGEHDG